MYGFKVEIICSTTEVVEYGMDKLFSFDITNQMNANIAIPSFGIISQTARVEINDIDGTIAEYIMQRKIKSGLEISVLAVNNSGTVIDTIFKGLISSMNYQSNASRLVITMTDGLLALQRKSCFKTLQKTDIDDFSCTAYELFDYIRQYSQISVYLPTTDALDKLNNTIIPYFFLESGTLWEQFDKLCNLCQLVMYADKNGAVVLDAWR